MTIPLSVSASPWWTSSAEDEAHLDQNSSPSPAQTQSPVDHPALVKKPVQPAPEFKEMEEESTLGSHSDPTPAAHTDPESFTSGENALYTAYFEQASCPSTNDSELSMKLDKLIAAIEQRDKEEHRDQTEEIILFSFLGLFIIYIVDSFSRAAKYTR